MRSDTLLPQIAHSLQQVPAVAGSPAPTNSGFGLVNADKVKIVERVHCRRIDRMGRIDTG